MTSRLGLFAGILSALCLATASHVASASAATLGLTIPTPDPAEQSPLSVTASGSTEHARTLFVFVESGATATNTCASTASDEFDKGATEITGTWTSWADGDSIAAGSYSKTH